MTYRKTLLFLLALCISISAAFTQSAGFKKRVPERELIMAHGSLPLPQLKLTGVITGEKVSLDAIVPEDLKFPGKPTLVIFWAKSWCGPCITRIDELLTKGTDRRFNIITINVEGNKNGKPTISRQDLQKHITSKSYWSRLIHYSAELDDMEELLGTRTAPLVLLLNKDLAIVDFYNSYSFTASRAERSLELVDEGRVAVSSNESFFQDEGFTTNSVFADHKMIKSRDGNLMLFSLQKVSGGTPISEIRVQRSGKTFVVHGSFKTYFDNGRLAEEGIAESGTVYQYKQWSRTGDILMDLTIPNKGSGYSKQWRENGTMKNHHRYVNRKLEGVQRSYDEKGRVEHEINYKNDEAVGLYRVYNEGVIKYEVQYSAGKPNGLAKEYDATGKVVNETRYNNGEVEK